MVISLSHFGEGKGHYKLLQEHRYELQERPGRPGTLATPSLTVTPLRKASRAVASSLYGGVTGARPQLPKLPCFHMKQRTAVGTTCPLPEVGRVESSDKVTP